MTDGKKREVKTKEEKRLLAEEATRFALEDTERRRLARVEKTNRLRAMRLAEKKSVTRNTKLFGIAAVLFVFAFWTAVGVGVHWAYS